jgi:hypothetical protein
MSYFKPLDENEAEALHDLYYEKGNIFGRDRLYDLFTRTYPEMTVSRRAVADFLNKQEIHQKHQRPMKRGVVRPTVAKKPGWIQLDCIDMSSTPYSGYDTIVNCVDVFSKYYWAYACKGQTVDNIKRAMEAFLDDKMICKFLQCDNGSSFKGDFPEFCKEKGIVLQYSKPHSPWSNGTIERTGGTNKRLLFQLMKTKGTSDWVSLLPMVCRNMNNARSFSTKQPPSELQTDTSLHEDAAATIENRANRQYKQKAKGPDLEVGDHVRMILDYDAAGIRKASKEGYWKEQISVVTGVVHNRKIANLTASYRLKDLASGEKLKGIWARWQLQKIPKDFTAIPKQPVRPGPVEGEDVYEVESILDKRTSRATRGKPARVEYKVKWRNWSVRSSTWEPLENLSGAKDAIREFEART